MLDIGAETIPTVEQFGQLPCCVKLPAAWLDRFDQVGLAPTLPNCNRRYPRVRCRRRQYFAALEMRQTFPSFPRQQQWLAVYPVDLGRGGVGLLHGEPLYPKERLRLVLSDNECRLIEVVRCRRIDEGCFSVGARFILD